jgi:hypothetical protein
MSNTNANTDDDNNNHHQNLLLPLEILCGPIASCLDRGSFNSLGLTCRAVHQRLFEQDDIIGDANNNNNTNYFCGCPWPTVACLFLPSFARCLAFSSCSRWLACGDMEGQVTFWNRKTGKSDIVWRPCAGRISPTTTDDDDGNDDDDDDTDTANITEDVVQLPHIATIGWINLIVIWKKEWVVCSNTESNVVYFYNIRTQQQETKTFPQLVRKLLVPNDRFLYVMTGSNRFVLSGDNFFVCKGITDEERRTSGWRTIPCEHCQGFPEFVHDVVPLDSTKFICWTKELQNDRFTTRLQLWDQETGQVHSTPIMTCSDGNIDNYDDGGGNNNRVDSDTTILAIATNTGTPATEGQILVGVAYKTGNTDVWLDLWWFDWWMMNGSGDEWRYHGHFPLHSHSKHVNTLKLLDAETWIVVDTTREQFLIWRNFECIRSLQANPNRFHVTCQNMDMAWIAWGSTMWIRDVTSFWNNDTGECDNGSGGGSQLVERGSGEFI